RYILCVWTISFGVVFLLNIALAVIDMENETGYMPVNMFEPRRHNIYQVHIMSTVFCSTFEIALSIERIVAIVKPRHYFFSDFAWKRLIVLTVLLVRFAYAKEGPMHTAYR
ncbi:hypothetical protein PENTCL1PPCAC_15454, partial [Pristionchus entomophagus]